MRLADAPDDDTADGSTLVLSPALLRGDPRLDALFASFHECVVLHEALIHEGPSARASRLLMAEITGDRLDDLRSIVRDVGKGAFEEKATELDDVAAGTEWRERSGPLSVAAYRLFGGSTALHVRSAKMDPPDAGMNALLASPLAALGDLVASTSFVEQISCSRSAGAAPQWRLQAALRDLRRFDEVVPRLTVLGFSALRGKYRHAQTILQPLGKDRWMAAHPAIDLGS